MDKYPKKPPSAVPQKNILQPKNLFLPAFFGLIFAIFCLILPTLCSAQTITVNADGSGDYPTIQAAVDAAPYHDIIVLTPGQYTGNGNRDINLDPFKGLTIRSNDPNDPNVIAATIIDCNGSALQPHRAFLLPKDGATDCYTVLDGLTIIGGYKEQGGAIYCGHIKKLRVSNCVFKNNSAFGGAAEGGAIYGYIMWALMLENCTFINNQADSGGAISSFNALNDPEVIISNCTFADNSAQDEGGAIASAGKIKIIDSSFTNNSAEAGGAISDMEDFEGDAEISHCVFKGNSATNGGAAAMAQAFGRMSFEHCLIEGNSADYGGGIAIASIHLAMLSMKNCVLSANTAKAGGGVAGGNYCTMKNCIISGNVATGGGGGGIVGFDSSITNCTVTGNKALRGAGLIVRHASLTNCIIWDNISTIGPQAEINPEQAHYNCIQDWSDNNGGNITYDPCFVDAGYWDTSGNWVEGDYHLRDSSMCIEAGDPEYVPEANETDMDGQPRLLNYCVDIGADEVLYKPRIITVDDDGPADFYTIQGAINRVRHGDTVVVAPGTYSGDGNRDLDLLKKIVTVRSTEPNDPNIVANTIIDCNGSASEPHRGFYVHRGEDANSVINGFTITNGYAPSGDWPDYCGGAIFCTNDSSPVITNCLITNSYAPIGGGIYFYGSRDAAITNCTFTGNSALYRSGACGFFFWSPASAIFSNCRFENNWVDRTAGGAIGAIAFDITLTDCTFNSNQAPKGGAIDFDAENDLTLVRCDFQHNSTTSPYGGHNGGAATIRAKNAVLDNCTFAGNVAVAAGGAISVYDSSMVVSRCRFNSNRVLALVMTGGGGGAIYNNVSDSIITNCCFNGNISPCGGAISNFSSSPEILNCTFVGNKGYGAAVINWLAESNPFLANCILWDEGQKEIHNMLDSNITITYSDVQGGWPGTGNINSDPCFIDRGYWDPNGTLADVNDDFWVSGDYHLLPDSACINAGDPCHPYDPNEKDLDGKPRVIGGRIDMGAYEFNPNTPPVADAGPDQEAYAWLDGIADVNLDGSGSYDDDGDSLTYLWSWQIGSDVYKANGVNPTIELPVGEHTIELIVNDGLDDSEPNYTTVTVIEPLQCFLRILPRTINQKSRQRYILAWLSLPAGITRDDIDPNVPLTLYPGQIEASRQFIFENKRRDRTNTNIIAFFKKKDLMNAIPENGPVQLEVVGQLVTGRYFFGQRTVRIINPPHQHPRQPRWR